MGVVGMGRVVGASEGGERRGERAVRGGGSRSEPLWERKEG